MTTSTASMSFREVNASEQTSVEGGFASLILIVPFLVGAAIGCALEPSGPPPTGTLKGVLHK